MKEAIVDACCFINLYATGDFHGFLAGSKWSWHIAEAALAESLYIRVTTDDGDERREPIVAKSYIDAGLITIVDVQSAEEIELYVRLAGSLDDAEAMALSLAKSRNWILATDDRKARRFAEDFEIAVIGTPELIEKWAKRERMARSKVRELLVNVQRGARFFPPQDSPAFAWWSTYAK
jgi:predicted nucleic acid-binding protein